MTGDIVLANDPDQPLEPATKQYVDGLIEQAGVPHVIDTVTPPAPVDGLLWTHPTEDVTPPQTLPIGSVIMWAGDASNVPTGWLLCDGTPFTSASYPILASLLGTGFGTPAAGQTQIPDMRDRFVVGAGSTYSRNSKGGSDTVTLALTQMPLHDHPLTHTHQINPPVTNTGTQSVNHTHPMGGNTGPDSNVAHSHVTASLGGRPTASTGTYNQNTGTESGQPHTHSINIAQFTSGGASASVTGDRGSSQPHENRPPYIGMFYIIKAAP